MDCGGSWKNVLRMVGRNQSDGQNIRGFYSYNNIMKEMRDSWTVTSKSIVCPYRKQ